MEEQARKRLSGERVASVIVHEPRGTSTVYKKTVSVQVAVA
jgi:hypothetical protein